MTFNMMLQMVLYAPLIILFVNVMSHDGGNKVAFSTVARSVGVFLGIPFKQLLRPGLFLGLLTPTGTTGTCLIGPLHGHP